MPQHEGKLMLKSFRNEIPDLDDLIRDLAGRLADTTCDLDYIKDVIYDHILDRSEWETDDEFDEKASAAMSISLNAVDDIIGDLPVNEDNSQRIRDYTYLVHSYSAYNRLVTDFREFMTEDARRQVIEEGKQIFIAEVTEDWE